MFDKISCYCHILRMMQKNTLKMTELQSFKYIGLLIEPVHEISNNVACATSKASDQPAHTRSLIRAFARRLSIL